MKKLRGVWAKKDGKFAAEIQVDKKRHYCGTFNTAEEAARAYDAKALEISPYLPLNFPTQEDKSFIYTKSGDRLLVDPEYWDILYQQNWHLQNGYGFSHRPTATKIHRKVMELVLGNPLEPSDVVDHIDRNPLNNRKDNLRLVTPQQNSINSGPQSNNKSGYKGVAKRLQKNGKTYAYIARIQVKGKLKHLGTFTCPIEAAKCYDLAAQKHFGEYAYLNNPTDPA
jgi:hypothetical protein